MKRLGLVRLCYSANTEPSVDGQFFLHPLSTSTFDHQRALVLQQRCHRVIMENFLNTPGLLSLGNASSSRLPVAMGYIPASLWHGFKHGAF